MSGTGYRGKHNPLPDGRCEHRWANRVTRAVVSCGYPAGLRDGLDREAAVREERDRFEWVWHAEERFKWAANARAGGFADLVRLLIDGNDNGYPVEGGETYERDLIERFRAALSEEPS